MQDRSSKIFRDVFKISVCCGSGSALLFTLLAFLFSTPIVGIFTTDPLVTQYALQYFRIVPIGYAFFAAAFIEANIFQGIGRSWPGFWITLSRVGISLVITVISVKVLALPIYSIWLAIVAGSVTSSIFGLIWTYRALACAKSEEAPPSYVLKGEEGLPPPVG